MRVRVPYVRPNPLDQVQTLHGSIRDGRYSGLRHCRES